MTTKTKKRKNSGNEYFPFLLKYEDHFKDVGKLQTFILGTQETPTSVKDGAKDLKLSKSTAFRIFSDLEDVGVLKSQWKVTKRKGKNAFIKSYSASKIPSLLIRRSPTSKTRKTGVLTRKVRRSPTSTAKFVRT